MKHFGHNCRHEHVMMHICRSSKKMLQHLEKRLKECSDIFMSPGSISPVCILGWWCDFFLFFMSSNTFRTGLQQAEHLCSRRIMLPRNATTNSLIELFGCNMWCKHSLLMSLWYKLSLSLSWTTSQATWTITEYWGAWIPFAIYYCFSKADFISKIWAEVLKNEQTL